MIDHRVAIAWGDSSYPRVGSAGQKNSIAVLLERLFRAWGLDPKRPFKDCIEPGQVALIKPNWVRDYNPLGHSIDSLITHASLIESLMMLLAKEMDGRGTIIVADAPLQNCDFEKLMQGSQMNQVLSSVQEAFPNMNLVIEDWRLTTMQRVDWARSWQSAQPQVSRDQFGQEDVETHRVVNLGGRSFLEDIADYSDRFRVTCYKPSLMRLHHAPGKHEYLITNRVFDVDFLLNVAKMKTHIKAGLTGALKSLIGINGHKEYLPHHIKGPYFGGGDNYCTPNRFRTWYEDVYDWYWESFSTLPLWKRQIGTVTLQCLWQLSKLFQFDKISASSWRGNETIWRTTLDLNHALYFWSERRPKRIFNIIDGIIAGEGEGPLSPTPTSAGVLIGGENPAYVDAVMGQLMGYNLSRIPTVYHAIYHRRSLFAGPFLEDVTVSSAKDDDSVDSIPFFELPNLRFEKPTYWKGADRGKV